MNFRLSIWNLQQRAIAPAEVGLTPGRFVLFLAALVAVSFPSVLLGTQTFVFRDYGMFSYPVASYQRQAFWHGELPLWNPYNYCGVPFLAQWNTMCLYPGALIYLLLPMPWSLSFFCLAHLFWGGLGMYFLARHWTRHSLAAGLAGVIFSFNGLTQNFLMWPSHIATFSWVPWVLWLVPIGWRDGGSKLVLAVAVASVQMLAGGPETILFTWVILAVLVCGEWIRDRAGVSPASDADSICAPLVRSFPRSSEPTQQKLAEGRRDVRPTLQMPMRFVVIALLVGLVCAAQLLPFLELLRNSQRDSGFAALGYDWSMPVWGWANFVVPLFQTLPGTQGVWFQQDQGWTSSYYAGIGTVLLLVLALGRARDWRVWTLVGIVLLALVMALGDNGVLYRVLRRCVPGMGALRYAVKFVIPVLILAPLLAAIGFAAIKRAGKFECSCGVAFLLALALIAFLSWHVSDLYDLKRAWMRNALTRGGILVLMFGLGAGYLRSRSRFVLHPLGCLESRNEEVSDLKTGQRTNTPDSLKAKLRTPQANSLKAELRTVFGLLLLLVCWLDLRTHVPNQNPTAAPSVYGLKSVAARGRNTLPKLGEGRVMLAPEAEEILRLHSLSDLQQDTVVHRLAFFANCNLLEQVPQFYGFFSLAPGEIHNLANLPYVQTNRDFPPLKDFLGVSHVTAPGKIYELARRPTAMPLITAGQKAVFVDDETAIYAITQATNVDLRRTVFLPPQASKEIANTNRVSAQVSATVFEKHSVSFQMESAAPTLAVIAQSFYPAWKAYVDGRSTQVFRANYAFQAVKVPAGKHRVELRYQNDWFRAGVVLSIVGLIVCLVLLLQTVCLPIFGGFQRESGASRVAQICNLLYRRSATCNAPKQHKALAGAKSALLARSDVPLGGSRSAEFNSAEEGRFELPSVQDLA